MPANLLSVIKKLIPPKGIRRNLEGSELLDYVEDDPYLFEEEDGNTIDDTSGESGTDDENNYVETQTEITSTVKVSTTANSTNAIPSLRDETRITFKPHLQEMKGAFCKARRSVKKRIKEAHSNTVSEQEDNGNILNILKNM